MNSIPDTLWCVNQIVAWAKPQFNGKAKVLESPRCGFLEDDIVTGLEAYLKAEYASGNPAIEAQPHRGYCLNLESGLSVGITRQRRGFGRRGRHWLAFCIQPEVC